MPAPPVPSPDITPATSDPGDDTARRYRYQWTCAAIICCMLLDDDADAKEVFCEHHEDVLIKHTDSTFTGIQVKTRTSSTELWKTKDPVIMGSCARFAKLEAKFPGRFKAFQFLTNHPLYSAKNAQDFSHVLGIIRKAAAKAELPTQIMSFLSKLSNDAGCSEDMTFSALSKTQAIDEWPKLSDIESRLRDTLSQVWNGGEEYTFPALARAARALANECGRASSLAHEDTLPAYLPLLTSPANTELEARLAEKRFDKARILDILNQELNEIALLDGDPKFWSEPGTGSLDLLRKKLSAGGLSVVTCTSAIELRGKAEYLATVWTKKYGNKSGLQRYNHIRTLVLQDSSTALEATRNEDAPFGRQMLLELRNRFKERRHNEIQLFDCSDEHLEGFAYILTSECMVQWSLDCPWRHSDGSYKSSRRS
jgi:hypothetical protein